MGEKLRLDLDIATREAQSNLRAAGREAKALGTDIDDARTEGQKFAASLRQVTDNAAADFAQAQAAAEKLGAALGDELVAELKQAGGSVDALVADLKKAGLTYNDIEADAEALGDALRHANDVNKSFGTDIDARARVASDGLDRVRTSADQSGSVLANMVGNSVQDLGALGGIAGTAGMALGQMGEYATEGNISMSSLAKVAGPMAGITVAVTGITWAIGKMKEESKRAAQDQANMLEIQKQIRDGKFEEAGLAMAESYGAVVTELEKMGVPQDEVMDFILGISSEMPTYNKLLEENKIQFEEGGVGLTDFGGKLDDVGGKVYSARDAFTEQGEALETTDGLAATFTGTLVSRFNPAVVASGEAARTAAGKVGELETAWSNLKGEIDDRSSFLDIQDTFDDLQTKGLEAWNAVASGADNAESVARDYEQAQLDAKGELVDYIEEVLKLPPEKVTKILSEFDAGNLDYVEQQLTILTRNRTMNISVQANGGIGYGNGPRAIGTTPSGLPESGMTTVGENGPERVWLPKGTNIATASQTAGMSGGGSSVTNVYNQTIYTPAALRPSQVARALRRHNRDTGQ